MESYVYEQYIDFIYTTLLMAWGGSLIGIGILTVPFIFKYYESPTKAAALTTRILKRQDAMIRAVAICMLVLFFLKRRLDYSYQYLEWAVYVAVLHLFIVGRLISRRLWTIRESIASFDGPMGNDPKRIRFRRWHRMARILYAGQIAGVVALLYLHAFGL